LSNIVLTGTGTGCVSCDGGVGTGDLSAFRHGDRFRVG